LSIQFLFSESDNESIDTALSNVTSQSDLAQSNEFTNVFVELYDLKLTDEISIDGAWQESARWIKYEEDVVPGVDKRWGPVHVAILMLSSVFQLRKSISKG
jgi:hypothetical protein